MFEVNIEVPNLSSGKYSTDEKFFLLETYLNELNDSLSHIFNNVIHDATQSTKNRKGD